MYRTSGGESSCISDKLEAAHHLVPPIGTIPGGKISQAPPRLLSTTPEAPSAAKLTSTMASRGAAGPLRGLVNSAARRSLPRFHNAVRLQPIHLSSPQAAQLITHHVVDTLDNTINGHGSPSPHLLRCL